MEGYNLDTFDRNYSMDFNQTLKIAETIMEINNLRHAINDLRKAHGLGLAASGLPNWPPGQGWPALAGATASALCQRTSRASGL
jgi:hypothetical protein